VPGCLNFEDFLLISQDSNFFLKVFCRQKSFSEGQENIFLPAEPMFLPDTPPIQALGGALLQNELKLISFSIKLGFQLMKPLLEDKRIFFWQQNLCFFLILHRFKLLVVHIFRSSSNLKPSL
jgi:hypothetical protein